MHAHACVLACLHVHVCMCEDVYISAGSLGGQKRASDLLKESGDCELSRLVAGN